MNPGANSESKWKVPQLTNYIAREESKIFPIIALTETWLKPHIQDAQIYIPGYEVIRSDRSSRKGGGVLLYLSDQLPPSNIQRFDDKYCEAIICTCETSKTIIGNVYRPPNAEHSSYQNMMKFLQDYLSDYDDIEEYDLMILGDFNLPNISWPGTFLTSGSPKMMQHAAESLTDFMDRNFLNQHVTDATRGSNILDLFITNNDSLVLDINITDTALSDHRKVEIMLPDNSAYTPITSLKVLDANSFRSLKLESADWPKINEVLSEVDWELLRSDCPTEDFPELFRLILLHACLSHTPKKAVLRGVYKPSKTRECRIIGRKKRKLQARLNALKSKNRPNCAEVIVKVERQLLILQLKMRDAINGEREQKERDALKKVKDNSKFFYTYAKQFLKRRSEIKLLIDDDNQPIHDKKEIADVLARQFKSVSSDPNAPQKRSPSFSPPEISSPMTDEDMTFTEEDIIQAIKEVKPNAASGPDEIPIKALKECKENVAHPIFLIWQDSVANGVVPSCYKESVVTPIHKKDSKVKAKNYRPVSLTSHIVKIFERVLRTRIVDFFERNEIICNSQHGFRKGRSCLTELLDHIDDILSGLVQNKDTDVIYLDYAKAFDKVDHELLIQKLRIYGLHPKAIEWISSFLTDRTQSVVVNGVHSFIAIIISGVPQGTVLGPILFIIFINDIGKCIKYCIIRCFADDTRLSMLIGEEEDCAKLQEDLYAVIEWSAQNNMQLHEDKFELLSHRCREDFTKELPFGNEHCHYDTTSGVTIYPVDSTRDLGVIIASDLSWQQHVHAAITRAKSMSAWVFNVFKSRDQVTMLTLYKSLIRSILEYCCPVWHPSQHGTTHLTQAIETLQRSFTAKISGCQGLDYWQRLKKLKLMSLQRRRERYIIINVWKILNKKYPNITDIEFHTTARRGIVAKVPSLPKNCKQKHLTLYESSFAVLGPRLWNTLPAEITLIDDLEAFKIALYNNFLRNMPDKPPVRGPQYAHVNTNSMTDQGGLIKHGVPM